MRRTGIGLGKQRGAILQRILRADFRTLSKREPDVRAPRLFLTRSQRGTARVRQGRTSAARFDRATALADRAKALVARELPPSEELRPLWRSRLAPAARSHSPSTPEHVLARRSLRWTVHRPRASRVRFSGPTPDPTRFVKAAMTSREFPVKGSHRDFAHELARLDPESAADSTEPPRDVAISRRKALARR
jgi:hypothetical protein